jgi:tRNA threonylcarbamoyladenosine biosynthesis protein TsaB
MNQTMLLEQTENLVVSLELSQRDGSVAAKLGRGEIFEAATLQGDRDKDSLMPALDNVVAMASSQPQNIKSIFVSVGPGGFTGLRVSVATAKMISFVTQATIVPVETSLGVVCADQESVSTSLVISAIKKETCWLSVVKKEPHWCCSGQLIEVSSLSDFIESGCVLYGDSFLPKQITNTCHANGVEVRNTKSTAASILKVGLVYLSLNKTVDPENLLPLYPREPEAVRMWKEHH